MQFEPTTICFLWCSLCLANFAQTTFLLMASHTKRALLPAAVADARVDIVMETAVAVVAALVVAAESVAAAISLEEAVEPVRAARDRISFMLNTEPNMRISLANNPYCRPAENRNVMMK